MCMFCRSLFVFFLLAIVLSVRFTDSGYSFGIFKLFSKDIFLHTFNVTDPSVKIQHLFNKLEVGDLC